MTANQADNAQPSPTSPPATTLWARGGKRAFDLAAACVLLLITSPILLLAGALVKATSRGPLLFRQDRAGKDAAIFQPYKLRTMRGGRRPDPKELVPLDHPDITQIGFFLRRFKIDELPQLVNVLRGQMSLIGPRPTLPDQVQAYDAFRRRRLIVRPGITGLAQVNGNTAVSWDERILFDVAYVQLCSLTMDIGILLRTCATLIMGEVRMTRRFATTKYAAHVTPPEGYAQHEPRTP